jgi:predicted aldo/keto reductase-like oxidoreductase
VGPSADVAAFRKSIATSIELLAPEPEDYIDLVALHGINRTKELDWIFASGGCYSVLEVISKRRLAAIKLCWLFASHFGR